MMRVRLLGPVEVVEASGKVLSIGSALRRSLVSLLALHTGSVLSADWLIEHLWDGSPPESGVRALRFHISQLRKELGDPAVLETHAGGYRLTLPRESVDALDVEDRIRAARNETDPAAAAQILVAALELWRGAPFADAAACSTLDDEAGRLAEVQRALIEDGFRARLAAGEGRELVADLRRATADHPLRESLWAMLITAQYRAGLQTDALRSYEEIRSILAESLGLDPGAELQELQRRVLQHDPTLVATSDDAAPARNDRRHNLPTPATRLIDGNDRLGRVRELMAGHRLMTLTGTAGVGKTRLAVELGWSLLPELDGGVWMVDLSSVSSGDATIAAISSTLGVRAQPGSTALESIVDWLNGRELLLIVDNCEQVIEPVADLVGALLGQCPLAKILATSREPLEVRGERVHAVDVLDPGDGVALFRARAGDADASGESTDDDVDAVLALCRRLDGLPLAIELAAARVRSIAPNELLERLDDRFVLLRKSGRTGAGRHDTLRGAIEWSYQLLTPGEQSVFDQLSVFAGGFDLRAAEAVCTVPDRGQSVADALASLVDKSMVVADRDKRGIRYRLLETLKEFADGQLNAAGGSSEVHERHLKHYLEVAEQADTEFRGVNQIAGAATFEREWDNLRLAVDTAVRSANVDAAERLIIAARMNSYNANRLELGEWAERVLALEGPARPISAELLSVGILMGYMSNRDERADELLQRAGDVAATSDTLGAAMFLAQMGPGEVDGVPDPIGRLEAVAEHLDLDREWWLLVHLADSTFDRDTHEAHTARLVETAERVRAPTLLIEAAIAVAHSEFRRDPPGFSAALAVMTRTLAIPRPPHSVASAEVSRDIAVAHVGLDAAGSDAISACRSALIDSYELRYWYRVWHIMNSVALSLAVRGCIEPAAVILGKLEARADPFGFEYLLGFRERALALVRKEPGADEWMARGAAMDDHELVEHALAAADNSLLQHAV